MSYATCCAWMNRICGVWCTAAALKVSVCRRWRQKSHHCRRCLRRRERPPLRRMTIGGAGPPGLGPFFDWCAASPLGTYSRWSARPSPGSSLSCGRDLGPNLCRRQSRSVARRASSCYATCSGLPSPPPPRTTPAQKKIITII